MDLVDSKEREELNSEVAGAIKSRVFGLFANEMKKIVKERYNLSPLIQKIYPKDEPGELVDETKQLQEGGI